MSSSTRRARGRLCFPDRMLPVGAHLHENGSSGRQKAERVSFHPTGLGGQHRKPRLQDRGS